MAKFVKPGRVMGLGNAFSIGLAMVLAIVIGFGAGFWVDRTWPDAAPWGKMIGLGIGIAAAYRNLYIMVMRLKRDMEKDEPKSG